MHGAVSGYYLPIRPNPRRLLHSRQALHIFLLKSTASAYTSFSTFGSWDHALNPDPDPLQCRRRWQPCCFLSSTSKQKGKFLISWKLRFSPLKRHRWFSTARQGEHLKSITDFNLSREPSQKQIPDALSLHHAEWRSAFKSDGRDD